MPADDPPIPIPIPTPSPTLLPSPTHSDSVLALLPIPIPTPTDHDWPWQPILHHSNQVVLYNPTSHALSIRHSPSPSFHSPSHPSSQSHIQSDIQSRIQSRIQSHIQARSRSHDVQRPECPYCHRPFPRRDREDDDEYEGEMTIDSESEPSSAYHSRASNYFQLLAIANETASRPPSPPPPSPPPIEHRSSSHGRHRSSSHGRHRSSSRGTHRSSSTNTSRGTSTSRGTGTSTSRTTGPAFPAEKMADGYFSAFFQEECRLGMGASGTVFLCRHVLDGNYLGHFAVKKIAVGESHSYLLKILREVRLLERLHHPNIITYHHAWLETCQFSQFGPKVPTLHVLMQWAEGGSLDDFIDARLGRAAHHIDVHSNADGNASLYSGSGPGSGTPNTDDAPEINTNTDTDTDSHQSRSARIRAFRAYQRASPEERERLRKVNPSLPGVAPGFGGNGLNGLGLGLGSNGINGTGINGINGLGINGINGMNGRNTTWTPVHLLSPEEVKSLFADVVEGLAFLHNKSILHLDLKPGNVLLTWDEGRLIPRAMLSDFGTSRDTLHSSSLTTTPRSGNTGTLEYTAPESLPSPGTGTGTGRLPSLGTGRLPTPNTGTGRLQEVNSKGRPQEVNPKGRLREVDSKADMWSLGMILHKLLFFRLPYRYASGGDGDETSEPPDGAGRLDKLEKEVLEYPGFKSTPPLITSFESRRLPRAYLVLLESLLNVNPGSRPSCERVGGAIREGRLDPLRLETDPGTAGAVTTLIPLTRQRSNPDGNSGTTIRVEDSSQPQRYENNYNENTDADTSERRTGTPVPRDKDSDSGTAVPQSKEPDAFSSSSIHPRPEAEDSDGWTVDVANTNTNIDDIRRIPRLRLLWIRLIKSIILIAKVWNILSLCPGPQAPQNHPSLIAQSFLLAAALLDTLFDGLWIFSMVLGLLHVLVVRVGCGGAGTGGRCCG